MGTADSPSPATTQGDPSAPWLSLTEGAQTLFAHLALGTYFLTSMGLVVQKVSSCKYRFVGREDRKPRQTGPSPHYTWTDLRARVTPLVASPLEQTRDSQKSESAIELRCVVPGGYFRRLHGIAVYQVQAHRASPERVECLQIRRFSDLLIPRNEQTVYEMEPNLPVILCSEP